MSDISQEVLAEKLATAREQIQVGAQYNHYKDRLYTVIAVALNEESLEPCVIYQAEYGEKLTWIRPVSDWLKDVEWQGRITPRFTKI